MTIQPVASLKEFFRDALHDALAHQHVEFGGETEHYVVNLLTLFSDADALFESVPGEPRSRLKPLVVMLGEALEAPTQEAKFRGLQRLGDVSLFIAGFFSAGFTRKLVDIDSHIAMVGGAAGRTARSRRTGRRRGGARCARSSPSWRRSSLRWWTHSTRSARAPTSSPIGTA